MTEYEYEYTYYTVYASEGSDSIYRHVNRPVVIDPQE